MISNLIKKLFPYWKDSYLLTWKTRSNKESLRSLSIGLVLELFFILQTTQSLLTLIVWFLGPFSAGLGGLPWIHAFLAFATYQVVQNTDFGHKLSGCLGINKGPDFLR